MFLIILSILGGGTFAFLGESLRHAVQLYEDCDYLSPWVWFFYVAAGLFPLATIIKYIAWRVRRGPMKQHKRRKRH